MSRAARRARVGEPVEGADGTALPTGHFLPEEAPDLVLMALAGFVGES